MINYLNIWLFILGLLAIAGISHGQTGKTDSSGPDIPRGYVSRLQVQVDDQLFVFGPFVGYYFKPHTFNDLHHLKFICVNKQSFYTKDLPVDTLLFTGEALFQKLPESESGVPARNGRIVPVFFADAPKAWLESRPPPQEAFVHFHSLYNDNGAAAAGYWLKHHGEASFTYDMGDRVAPPSPLFHRVKPGLDLDFPRIIEFDHGPAH